MASPKYMMDHGIITSENPIVNAHGTLDEMPEDGIYEVQNMVVGTKSLPQDKWIDTRAYASMSEFLYFNKVLQIPLLIIHKLSGSTFRDLFEIFMKNDLNLEVIESIKNNFITHAKKIINGRPEFVYHKGWLDIHWPPGELELIRLVEEEKIEKFYEEAFHLLNNKFSNTINSKIIKDAVELNFNLLRLPNKKNNSIYITKYNTYDVYKDFINNDSTNLREENNELMIIREDKKFNTFNEWLQKVIWYGHRSGAYLCNAEKVNSIQLKKKSQKAQTIAK